jgi:two-component system, NtrC family, sensor histidine kinase HydH
MWRGNLSLRIAGPTILVSCLLLSLCAAAAVYLYRQQAVSARVHRENVASAQVGNDLKNTLIDLVALLRTGTSKVGVLHERVRAQLEQARGLADPGREKDLEGQLEQSVQRYLSLFEKRAQNGRIRGADLQEALQILEKEALPASRRLQQVNVEEMQQTETELRRTVQWVVWGLVGVCTLGALAGLLLGYGVARGLRRSIHHLSIHVQDAANKLRQDLPPVALREGGDLQQLHGQMQGVVREIEQVVEKLQQREREVLRAEQLAAVGQLAAGVAHELRNPLTSIKMLVQASCEDLEARGVLTEDLHIIELEIRRMERCLQTFLDFARPPRLECRRVSLAGSIERTLALIGGRARKQQVTLRFAPPDPPVLVEADEEQLRQLFVNLTLNALDVMPRGGTLEVEVRPPRGGDERGQVEVRVLDSGPGISAELLPRLFQPFVSGKETGLGLGLVTSRRIAESHGGTLQARNRPEGGACFTLRLPCRAGKTLAVGGDRTGRNGA